MESGLKKSNNLKSINDSVSQRKYLSEAIMGPSMYYLFLLC